MPCKMANYMNFPLNDNNCMGNRMKIVRKLLLVLSISFVQFSPFVLHAQTVKLTSNSKLIALKAGRMSPDGNSFCPRNA